MAVILGIDTGGTFTDGVIVDPLNKKVLFKAKALTTKKDLTEGIYQCLENMNVESFQDVALVSLSTTLATNALVEGKGGRAALIVIGNPPTENLPIVNPVFIKGRIDIKGREREPLSMEEIDQVLEAMKDRYDAIAVSGYASVRNPAHEITVKERVRQLLDLPVVCAHELTSCLGYYDRTVTAALNARLIPIIQELILAVKHVMEHKGIKAPLMIVRGNGSLMLDSVAMSRPIETILSGPAASIVGSRYLTKEEEGIVLDIGGTTSDLAHIRHGMVKINDRGAKVGGWRTCVQAAEVATYGIGGDSLVWFDLIDHAHIGPEKVMPLSCAATVYPHLKDELDHYRRPGGYELIKVQECDCFGLLKDNPAWGEESVERKIAKVLRDQPHSLFCIAEQIGRDPETLGLDVMVKEGWLYRISLTPTDILHGEGSLLLWNKEIADLAISIYARRRRMTSHQLIQTVKKAIQKKLTAIILDGIAGFEGVELDSRKNPSARYLFKRMTDKESQELIRFRGEIMKPIIGIGAPAKEWLSSMPPHFKADFIIPEHHEVANAIGAAVGQVTETGEALIRYDQTSKCYVVFGLDERLKFPDADLAVRYAEDSLRKIVRDKALAAGAKEADPIIRKQEMVYQNFTSGEDIFVETRIEAIAIGEPMWK